MTQAGVGLDPAGGPLIDPTANVIALNKAGHIRQDDLRKAERRYIESELLRVEAIANLKADHTKEIAQLHQIHDYAIHKAEAGRLDALRQNDREDVKALAAATTAKAEALQAQVATTAKTLADSFASAMAEQNKRVSAVELTQSAGSGRGQGAQNLWAIIAVAISVLVALLTLWKLSGR